MLESQFQTSDGRLVPASNLSKGDKILDHEGREVAVT